MRYYCLVLFFCLALTRPARCDDAPSPQAIARFIALQMEDARSRLTSFAYKTRVDFEQPGVSLHKIEEGELRQSGKQKWLHLSDNTTSYIGNDSSAVYFAGSVNPNKALHDDIDHPTDFEKKVVYARFKNDPLIFAYGTGDEIINTELLSKLNYVQWEGRRDNAPEHDYVLERYIVSATSRRRDFLLEINSNHSWMVAHSVFFNPQGQIRQERYLDHEMLTESPHYWYPSRVVNTRYTPSPATLNPTVESRLTITASDFHLVEWPNSQFTTASLGLAEGVHLIVGDPEGRRTSYVQAKDGLHEYIRAKPLAAPAPIPLIRSRNILIAFASLLGVSTILYISTHLRKKGGKPT